MELEKVEFEVDWDGERVPFSIERIPYAAGSIHIYLGRYYHGQVVYGSDGQWRVYLGSKSELDAHDVGVILELVEVIFEKR